MKTKLTSPVECAIHGANVIPKIIHYDKRGFLVEALKSNDKEANGDHFSMSYISLTVPGEARDIDRWHYHRHQDDRFMVILGELALALYDARDDSPTKGKLQVFRMAGSQRTVVEKARQMGERIDEPTYMIIVPIGVYHCVKGIGKTESIHINFPTRLYDPSDEGRARFADVSIAQLSGATFSWDMVEWP